MNSLMFESIGSSHIRIAAIVLVAVFIMSGCLAEPATPVQQFVEVDPNGTININAATAEDLRRIPGVGESTARKIIEHREEHGPFRRLEDLMQIRGISDKRFRKIRHLIRTE